MRASPKFAALLIIAGLIVLGAVQEQRIANIRETEAFYRWVISAANSLPVEGSLERDAANPGESRDDDLFSAVADLTAERLTNVPVSDGDLRADGEPWPPLVRAVRHGGYDSAIWSALRSSEAAGLRDDYYEYLRNEHLQSAGSQFKTADLYGGDAQQTVGLTSLFFGLRKLAANFIWLQVERYWHAGAMHRMVPLMYTATTLDPSFIEAYTLGAWHMAYNLPASMDITPEHMKEWNEEYQAYIGDREKWYYLAADYLKDGIQKNPRSWQLYFDLGYSIYENKMEDHERAVTYLSEARRYERERWVDRMLFGAQMRNGQYEDAIEGWHWYLDNVDPESDIANRFIPVNQAFLAEAIWMEASECAERAEAAAATYREQIEQLPGARSSESGRLEAQAAEATEVAERMRALAAEKVQEARERWSALAQQGDVLAQSRLHWIQAHEWARSGRWFEAVSELEAGRESYLATFDEFSDLLIEYKKEAGIGLSTSEKMAVERRRELSERGVAPEREPIRRLDCPYQTVPAVDGDAA